MEATVLQLSNSFQLLAAREVAPKETRTTYAGVAAASATLQQPHTTTNPPSTPNTRPSSLPPYKNPSNVVLSGRGKDRAPFHLVGDLDKILLELEHRDVKILGVDRLVSGDLLLRFGSPAEAEKWRSVFYAEIFGSDGFWGGILV